MKMAIIKIFFELENYRLALQKRFCLPFFWLPNVYMCMVRHVYVVRLNKPYYLILHDCKTIIETRDALIG
jgi:hypothetical protein